MAGWGSLEEEGQDLQGWARACKPLLLHTISRPSFPGQGDLPPNGDWEAEGRFRQ